jgi:co-chaperonin GroES (HSP10)
MIALENFIISPKDGKEFNNTAIVEGIEMITSTSIEEAVDVNRFGIVKAIPINYKGNVQVGDEVVVHHNVFRSAYDHKGVIVKSHNHIKDDLYWVQESLVYMIVRNGFKQACTGFVFIEPENEEDYYLGHVEKAHTGTIKYGNENLNLKGLEQGQKIAFKRNCEYPFEINGEKLYLMMDKRITATLN